MKKLKYQINQDGCWIVTSHVTNGEGYHVMKRNGKFTTAHRYTYEQMNGEIPEGQVVRHKCDNKSCCNPNHLELGTHAENVSDRVERGRSAKGVNNGRSKLTEEQAKFIKYDKNYTKAELARMFEVDFKAIYNIKNNISWKHV